MCFFVPPENTFAKSFIRLIICWKIVALLQTIVTLSCIRLITTCFSQIIIKSMVVFPQSFILIVILRFGFECYRPFFSICKSLPIARRFEQISEYFLSYIIWLIDTKMLATIYFSLAIFLQFLRWNINRLFCFHFWFYFSKKKSSHGKGFFGDCASRFKVFGKLSSVNFY